MDNLKLAAHIRILEELLLHQDFSTGAQALEALLSDDFQEVNPAGKVVSRSEVIAWLTAKDPDARWELADFEVKSLGKGLVLATYVARQVHPANASAGGARHCSLWRETGKESEPRSSWQLVFHQSTRIG